MTERMNIRRMQVPERQSNEEKPFDVVRDISKKDWVRMLSRLDDERGENLTRHYELYAYMSLIGRDVLPPLPSDAAQHLADEIEHWKDFDEWDGFLEVAWSSGILRGADGEISLGELERTGIRTLIEKEEDDEDWSKAALRILQAQMIDRKHTWDFQGQTSNEDALQWAQDSGGKISQAYPFMRFAGCIRPIHPEMKIIIEPRMWQAAHELLDSCRETGAWRMFAQLAWYMKLASADEVRLTKDRQLEVISRRAASRDKDTPQMPDTLSL
jgi:hypothetical protein